MRPNVTKPDAAYLVCFFMIYLYYSELTSLNDAKTT